MDLMREFLATVGATAMDVLPVAFFMLFVYCIALRQQLARAKNVFVGLGFVVVGLALLLLGVDKALFPAGRMMVQQLSPADTQDPTTVTPWSSFHLIYVFAFCITFAASIAEPALLAVAQKVNDISGGAIKTWGLRIAAALGVAIGVMLGAMRIVSGLPIHWCMAVLFAVIFVQTLTAPREILPLAYDTGGVSTTVVTVPMVAALGLGLAELMPGRNPLLDGFGLVAFACTFPAITVLGYAQIAVLIEKRALRRSNGDSE